MTPAGGPELDPRPFEARARGGNYLRGEASGSGPVIVQAHGITAARSYVTHGSKLLQRRGFTAVPYDARGHGESEAAPPGEEYTYAELARDMGSVVESQSADGRVVLAGHSMGAHTAVAYALAEPDRVAGVVAIGPAARGLPPSPQTIAYWDGLAAGLERGGIDGFIEVYDDGSHDPEWREIVLQLARRRLALHHDLNAVAAALRSTTRSIPFEGLEALAGAGGAGAGGGQSRRGRSRPSPCSRRGVDAPDPGSPHGDRGRGRVAAGLAGREALARDRRVLRVRRPCGRGSASRLD